MLNDPAAIPFYCPIVNDYVMLEDFLAIDEATEILSEAYHELLMSQTSVEEE